ncbi:tatD [Mytilus edulis]|uniref:TatD n=1 Tax=Mytilus edulis TaxID=6550 RepID=A0A8S3SLX6_MYTED|nr:tatD [Mytilus edulis]
MEDERKNGAAVPIEMPSHPRNPVNLVGGVMVHCDPGTWPSAWALQEPPRGSPWVTAIGVHPKKAQQLDDSSFGKMEQLVDLPGVRAIGEVGLDQSQRDPSLQRQLQMSVVNLNTCSFQELLQLPGIGIKTGEQIMDIRESKGLMTESDLATISHLRVTRGLLSRLDFSPNGGGHNIGPPPQAQGRHGEMLDMGHIAPQGTPSQVQGQAAFRQEAWHQGQSPGPLEGPSQMDSAFLEYSSNPGDANARPEPTGNWDGGYREQLQKKEWSHHDIGDPNQGSPSHHMYRGSIGNKPYWPGKDSAWDKLTPNYWGTPSHPIGHASNYAGQGSAPCTQPAYTGGGQYEMACSKYGKGQDNRGADTRQTPSHDNGDRQPKNQYNQGYTAVLPQGVTAGVGYGQQAYPVPYNEDRPIENTRGPDNRGGARGTLGGISKVTNAPKNINNSSQAPLQEAAHLADRQGQKVATTDGGKSASVNPSIDRGPPWEGVCYHCLKPGHVKKDCLDLQERDRTVTSTIQSSRTATGPLNLNGTTQEAGVAATTETTLASDEEAQESWDSTSDGEAHTTLVEGVSDEKIVTVFPTPVVDGGMTDNTENSHTSLTFEDPSSTGETDRKAATESNSPLNNEKVITFKSPVNQESVYINPESPDLGLGLLFKTDNVGTRYFNQQQPPPVDSGTSVLCVSTVRSGPNRRQWDPGIPYLNKGINTVQVRKNENRLFTTENGSAQPPGSNYIVDMQPLNGPVLVCIKTGKSWHTIQTRTIHSCLGSQFVGNPLYYLLINQ